MREDLCPRGRQKKNWSKCLLEYAGSVLKKQDIDLDGVSELASERDHWRAASYSVI